MSRMNARFGGRRGGPKRPMPECVGTEESPPRTSGCRAPDPTQARSRRESKQNCPRQVSLFVALLYRLNNGMGDDMSDARDSCPIQPCLVFNSPHEEASQFHRKAFGADPEVMTRFRESPDPYPPGLRSPGWESQVTHASLRVGAVALMASDGGSAGKADIDGFSLSMSAEGEAETGRLFAAPSDAGKVRMPLGMVALTLFLVWMERSAFRGFLGWRGSPNATLHQANQSPINHSQAPV